MDGCILLSLWSYTLKRVLVIHMLEIKAVSSTWLNVKDIKGILHSFSRKVTLCNNACIGSFHFILKKKEVNQKEYYDFKIAKRVLFE